MMSLSLKNIIGIFVVTVITSFAFNYIYKAYITRPINLSDVKLSSLESIDLPTTKFGEDGVFTNGKLGIGMTDPIWALDVIHYFEPENGTGGLTPQLSHYNTARFQQLITPREAIKFTDVESVYGVLNYNAAYPISESYMVGIHGDVYVNGPANIGPQMITGLWGSATYDGTATSIETLMGVRGEITVNSGSGVKLASLYAAKPELNGGETTYAYGVYIEDMSGMSLKRALYPYAIYSEGDIPSYFAGKIGVGTTNPLLPIDIASNDGIRIGPEAKHIDLFTIGAGNDINSVGGTLFINFNRENAVSIDNSTLYVDTNQRIGIGTTSPQESLHVAFGNLLFENNFGIQIKTSTNVAKNILYLASDNTVKLNSAGASLFINPDALTETAINYANNSNILLGYSAAGWIGKVGIGVVSPQEKLQIANGNILLDNNSAVKFKNTIGSSFDILSVNVDNGVRIKSAGESIFINPDTVSETTINYANNGNILLGYAENGWTGKVGIGTTNPVVALDITSDTGIKIGTENKGLRLYTSGIGSDIYSLGGTLYFNYDQLQSTDIGNTTLYVDKNGKVGIGTSLPEQTLDITGTASISGTIQVDNLTTNGVVYADANHILQTTTSGQAGQILVGATGSAPVWVNLSTIEHAALGGLTDDDHPQYALLSGRNGGQRLIGGTGTTDGLILQTTSASGTDGANIHFLVGSNGSIEALTITNDGKIGVGLTNPTYAVDINQDTLKIGRGSTGLNWTSLYVDAGNHDGANDTEGRLIFAKNSNPQWQIYNTGSRLGFFDYLGNGDTLTLNNGNVGVGTTDPQGKLDVASTTGGLIVPRMTTAERDVLTAVNGTIIYNITTNAFNFYENGSWVTK